MEDLEQTIKVLDCVTHLMLQNNVSNYQCNYLNELQNKRFYYQLDGKLKYLYEDAKEEYDKLTTDIARLKEMNYIYNDIASLQSKLIEQRKELLK